MKERNDSSVNRLRRALLKSGGLGSVLATLPVGPVSAGKSVEPNRNDADAVADSLLPADSSVAPEPEPITEPVEGSLGDSTVVRRQVRAEQRGTLGIDFGGELDGAGKFGLVGSPYVESTWTAPASGEYTVTANYHVRGQAEQEAEALVEIGGASVVTFLESALAVVDPDDRVMTHGTSVDHQTANEDFLPVLVEEALSWAIPAVLGPSGWAARAILARSGLKILLDHVFDIGSQANESIAEDGQIQTTFLAEEGRTYRFRFAAEAGYSGKSTSDQANFRADFSTTVELNEFTVGPTGTEVDRAEHLLTVRKGDTDEGFGAYMVSASGDIWQEDESEALIDGSTALDFVGPARGEDTLRFAGDVENFMLKGPAKVYLDGEQVDPDILGSAEALTNTLRIESAGTQTGFFAVTVSGTIVHDERGLAEAYIRGASALDWVGKERGTDRFRFSGEIIEFVLKGDANVYVNGEQVDPGALGV